VADKRNRLLGWRSRSKAAGRSRALPLSIPPIGLQPMTALIRGHDGPAERLVGVSVGRVVSRLAFGHHWPRSVRRREATRRSCQPTLQEAVGAVATRCQRTTRLSQQAIEDHRMASAVSQALEPFIVSQPLLGIWIEAEKDRHARKRRVEVTGFGLGNRQSMSRTRIL
jgi:hypothetical protein